LVQENSKGTKRKYSRKLEKPFVRIPNIVYNIHCPIKSPAFFRNLETPWLENPKTGNCFPPTSLETRQGAMVKDRTQDRVRRINPQPAFWDLLRECNDVDLLRAGRKTGSQPRNGQSALPCAPRSRRFRAQTNAG